MQENNMKKYIAIACSLIFVAAVSCSKGSESEAKAIIKNMISVTDATSEKLEKAADAKTAGDALSSYVESMKAISVKSADFQKKYTDLNMQGDEKLKTENDALTKSMDRFSKALAVAMTKFANSKEFADAIAKMGELMKSGK
jgi:hypothetical protein